MSDIVKSGSGGLVGLIGSGLSIGKPFSKEIFLIDTHIAGTSHVVNIKAIGEKLAKGIRVNFFRELDNKYDVYAIMIKDNEGNKVGYIPKGNNEILARLMDAGKLGHLHRFILGSE